MEVYDGADETHIWKSNKFLLSALHALIRSQEEVQKEYFQITKWFALLLLGRVFDIVSQFCEVYEGFPEGKASAFKYRMNLEKTSLCRQYVREKKEAWQWENDGHNDIFNPSKH